MTENKRIKQNTKLRKRLLSMMLALVMVLAMLPASAFADGGNTGTSGTTGNVVVSFEKFDATTKTITLLVGPQKVPFDSSDTGATLAEKVLGVGNADISASGMMNSFTIGGKKYANDYANSTSWFVYKNNAPDGVGPGEYAPTDGDVYRFILTSWDPATYDSPTMPHDLSALYWAMSECTDNDKLQAAKTLVTTGIPSQTAINQKAADLGSAGIYRILTDARTIQVNKATTPYTYINTLTTDKKIAAAGEEVTVTVTVPGGKALKNKSLKANDIVMTQKSGTTDQYTFTMPSSFVSITAEFSETASSRLSGAVFSYDEAGTDIVPVTPAFSSTVTEYSLKFYDYKLPKSSSKIYSTLTFDETNDTTAAWFYYMTYSGTSMYTPGPSAARTKSGVAYGHNQSNLVSSGMTNGGKHRVDVTPAGGTAKAYYFTMTKVPTLTEISINGVAVEGFSPENPRVTAIVPDSTVSAEVAATLFNEDNYAYVGTTDISDTVYTATLDADGSTDVVIKAEDGDDGSFFQEYTLTIKTQSAAAAEAKARKERINTLMENIAQSYKESDGEWVIMDMSAYKALRPSTTSVTSDDTKQAYINKAISSLQGENIGDTTYAKAIMGLQSIGKDPQIIYPADSTTPFSAIEGLNKADKKTSEWNAPYTLMAYNQGEYNTDEYETPLIQAILNAQESSGSWSGTWGADATGTMLSALVPYYSSRNDVKTSLDKAVDWLSGEQGENGSFGNSNTDALVIVGLAAMGIDPDTDSRFIKGGNSLMDGILSYALADNSGFDWKSNVKKNANSTEQSFRALVAATKVSESNAAYNFYDFSSNSITPAKAEGSGSGSGGGGGGTVTPVDPTTGKTDINVTVSVKSDTDYWLRNKTVTVKEGSQVYHAYIKAIEGSGITQSGASAGYVKTMTYDGKTLAELTKGPNSGWLYKLNGNLPDLCITEQNVNDGDTVLFYYTDDWTKDPDAGSVTGGGTGKTDDKKDEAKTEEALKAEETAADQNGQAATTFSDVADSHWAKAAIEKVVAKGLFKGTTEKEFAPNANMTREQMWMVLARLAGNTEQNSDVVAPSNMQEAAAWAKGKAITDGSNPKGDVTREQFVTLMWRTLGSPASSYDLSKYADSSNISDWAKTAMAWAVETGLVSGTSATKLSPSATATRAQIATIFARYLDK